MIEWPGLAMTLLSVHLTDARIAFSHTEVGVPQHLVSKGSDGRRRYWRRIKQLSTKQRGIHVEARLGFLFQRGNLNAAGNLVVYAFTAY